MVNKFEAIGIALSIGFMVLALYFIRLENTNETLSTLTPAEQSASVFVAGNDNNRSALAEAIVEASSVSGDLKRLIVNDVRLGEGEEVEDGDVVSVHYIGTLKSGQQFDNSYLKGSPFSFEVGAGKVIAGWDQGILGMKVGGQRILVIPAELAYGREGSGPIPGNATLVFAIELISIE